MIKLLRIKENKHYNTNINNISSFINKKYKDLIKNDELNTYRNHKINKSRLNKKRIRNLNNKNNLFLIFILYRAVISTNKQCNVTLHSSSTES